MVAIYCHETNYGSFTGDFDLIRSLATLAFEGRRLALFEPELIAALKTLSDGSTVRIKDVARVELGAESYTTITRVNGHPGAGMAISLSPGSDALKTAELVKARMDELAADMPEGLGYASANDSTNFIKFDRKSVV